MMFTLSPTACAEDLRWDVERVRQPPLQVEVADPSVTMRLQAPLRPLVFPCRHGKQRLLQVDGVKAMSVLIS